LNSISNDCATTIAIARIDSVLDIGAEHSWSDSAPFNPISVTLSVIDDVLLNLEKIFGDLLSHNIVDSPTGNGDFVSWWADTATK
jgi:hypothetical protein